MNIWHPKLSFKRWLTVFRIALACTVLAGVYGAVHDQISYTISPEYFTRMKFHQFRYANFGWPQRVFAAEVGFLATWWVGLIGGWILARLGLAELAEARKGTAVLTAFAMAAGMAVLTGAVGAGFGVVAARSDLAGWKEVQDALELLDLPAFVIVAYLHAASYIGGLLGLVCAAVYVRRNLECRPSS
jgi:hypothetical protein